MTDTHDMGPFAGMEPALVAAISDYGTPPYRETVRVVVRDVGSYSFDRLPTTVEGWIGWLDKARANVPPEHAATLTCVLSYERGRWDEGDSADLIVSFTRPETDAEMEERVGRGVAYLNEREAKERAAYMALRAKFG